MKNAKELATGIGTAVEQKKRAVTLKRTASAVRTAALDDALTADEIAMLAKAATLLEDLAAARVKAASIKLAVEKARESRMQKALPLLKEALGQDLATRLAFIAAVSSYQLKSLAKYPEDFERDFKDVCDYAAFRIAEGTESPQEGVAKAMGKFNLEKERLMRETAWLTDVVEKAMQRK
ncbi:hypothetical protein [Cupriavidus pauculus]|uniref:hypothetical protein n=1 Tax=Cupriavidus pauculus TaxID=82633 RepID=UPI0038574EA3